MSTKTVKKWKRWLVVILLLGGFLTLLDRCRSHRENSQDEPILAAARKYGVDPALVKAVVWRESGFDPRARGRKGEIGLMQIRGEAAHEWAQAESITFFWHEQLFDPRKNTLAGAWYLRQVLKRYRQTDNPIPYALADYNAGRSNVLRWNHGAAATNSVLFIQQIGFPSTKSYVQTVLKRYRYYRPIFGTHEKSAGAESRKFPAI